MSGSLDHEEVWDDGGSDYDGDEESEMMEGLPAIVAISDPAIGVIYESCV